MADEVSKIRMKLTYGLTGQSFIFNGGNITNFTAIYNLVLGGGSCTARLEYGGDTYNGTVSVVGSEILVTFDTSIIAPAGSCIDIECEQEEEEEEERDCKNVQLLVNDDVRLAVLDDDGCLKGWIRLGDIYKDVVHPNTLCKLYGVSSIPQGRLTASDRILTVDSSCMIKSVSANDIAC